MLNNLLYAYAVMMNVLRLHMLPSKNAQGAETAVLLSVMLLFSLISDEKKTLHRII